CHSARPSLFSTASGFDDYRGFLNLCVVLLVTCSRILKFNLIGPYLTLFKSFLSKYCVISNARVFLENILKYGILVDPLQWLSAVLYNPYQWPNLLLVLGSSVFIFIAFHIERFLARVSLKNKKYNIKVFFILVFLFIFPHDKINKKLYVITVGSLFSCSVYVVVFLKLWSYAQTNKWYREGYTKALSKRRIHRTSKEFLSRGLIQYPYNLSYRNLLYFMAAPTLCYEANYPRTSGINKSYLMRRALEIVSKNFNSILNLNWLTCLKGICLYYILNLFLFQLELALIQQWVVPVLQKAILPIHNYEGYTIMERLLKLSVPNHFIWLVFFYFFFHSVLNALAEVMKFADREFYRDWWNAETIVYFWQAWNIPVHKWCVRHCYKPLLSIGCPKFAAQVSVFLLSAFFHEYLVSIPLHMFKAWAFFGMTMQIPLSVFTSWVSKRFSSNYGNMIVWMSLILGQPVAILAYVYHYYVTSYT
uniref:O-acyltransferase n=1 Tax=Ciona savignyi TaxID=51511 RepID=H2YCG7_CIOSA